MKIVKMLYELFGKREKKKFTLLFFFMIIGAVLETAGVGLIVPFVGILTNPDQITENALLNFFYTTFNFESPTSFLIFATIALLAVFIFKNAYLVFFYHFQYKVIYNEQIKLSKRMLTAYLLKPYIFHLERNTAQLQRNVDQEVKTIFNRIVIPGFLVLTESTVMLFVLILLLFIAPLPTLLAGALFGGGIFLFFHFFKTKIAVLGKARQSALGQMIKWINQSFGSTKEVKVLGKEAFFIDNFTHESKTYAKSMRFYQLMKQAPRMFVETIVVATILIIVLVIMIQTENLTTLISTTALFAMAAFRLMPSINRMVSAITDVRYNRPSLDIVYEDLIVNNVEKDIDFDFRKRDEEAFSQVNKSQPFHDKIELNHLHFKYPLSEANVIQDVSLEFPIGSSVAFVGPSGSGKTTLVDIMLGVLQPDSGSIEADGININEEESMWQNKIGYIPQGIYLFDDTIKKNIAFGVPEDKIDEEAVWESLRKAQLDEHVKGLPGQLETSVGERGVKLSGGQRQRIGIARALYSNPEVLFLDEATSALDNETEKGIMKAIDDLRGEKTLIIIAHRLSTIENCDIIFEMEDGRLKSRKEQHSDRNVHS